ncbi:hypothetical protein AB395_00005714 (plasmid) [Sinorhizobium fredii CCBAU 45436]|nr:hypothetical protein AB395_00005714 [Sinorhizobium fredii CCBAU 45436]
MAQRHRQFAPREEKAAASVPCMRKWRFPKRNVPWYRYPRPFRTPVP